MASLYKRGDIYWVKFTDRAGRVRRESAGCRVSLSYQVRKAGRILRDKNREEEEGRRSGLNRDGKFDLWVDSFFTLRHSNAHTLERYQSAWGGIRWWLNREGLTHPQEVDRSVVMKYAEWRGAEKPLVPGRTRTHIECLAAAPLTVKTEVMVFSSVMSEAVIRGFAETNPCFRLGLRGGARALKREITEDEEGVIREALKGEKEWMRICFNIGMAQGIRLGGTALDLVTGVDWERLSVTVRGKKRTHTTRLNPDIVPMLQELRDEGRKKAFVMKPGASGAWTKFFRKNGLEHLTFHCTRVTAITRCARKGVPRAQAMTFFSHASHLVHEIYQRLGLDDTDDTVDALRSAHDVEW